MTVRHLLALALCSCCVFGAARAATPTDDGAQIDVTRGNVNLDRPSAPAAPEPAQIGNPLWAVPLGALTATRERPLFTPSRRPPAPAVVAIPRVVQPAAVARPVVQDHPNLALIGTVVGKAEGIGVFLDQSTHNFVRLKIGEGHAGWILRSVKTREATLEKDRQTQTLSLPTPHDAQVRAPIPKRPE